MILIDQVFDFVVVDRGYCGYGVGIIKILISGMWCGIMLLLVKFLK